MVSASRFRFAISSFARIVCLGAIVTACRAPTETPPESGPPQPTIGMTPIASRDVPGFFTVITGDSLNPDEYRQQWNDVLDWRTVADWARMPDHRGHLFVVGRSVYDSVSYASSPSRFARDYCAFVKGVRAADAMAQFSPGLIDDTASEEWLDGFAATLLRMYRSGYCSYNPVSEWEFVLRRRWSDSVAGAKSFVDDRVKWTSRWGPLAVPSVLAWTLDAEGEIARDDSVYVNRMREFKSWLFAHDNVIGSRALGIPGAVYGEATGRIAGPRVVHPSATCIWVAETAGASPVAFTWLMNGVEVSTQSSISIKWESGFTLELIVSDATGGRSRAKIAVEVSLDAPACL